MHKSQRLLAGVVPVLIALAVMVSCEKSVHEARSDEPAARPHASVPPDAPATQDVDPVIASATLDKPTTTPAPTQPAVPTLAIDGFDAHFPPTRMLLHARDGAAPMLTAELFSDLPTSALRKYDGNELYLEMTLENAVSPQAIDGATWRFKSTRSGKADSPNGIFLNGQSTHLQPFDVRVRFDRRADGQLVAEIMGQFRAFEINTPDALAPSVGVNGALPVEIVKKR